MIRPTKITVTTTVLLIVGWLSIFTGCASQDAMYSVDDRLAQLEQEEAARKSNGQNVRTLSADLQAEMEALKEQMQRMEGRLEETLYVLNQKIAVLEEADRKRQQERSVITETTEDNRGRIGRVETYLNLERTASPDLARPGTTSPPKETPTPSAKETSADDTLYAAAKQDLDEGDYDAARKSFADLIQRFPGSGHADNAQFWIGESYYREQWYEKAILEYQKVIEKYPKGNKVQAALLKQGFSFLNLGDSANARLILKDLIKKYPKSNEAVIARKKLGGLK